MSASTDSAAKHQKSAEERKAAARHHDLIFRMGETGSYAVNPDCTGSQEINLNAPGVPPGTSGGVIVNMFVISGGGRSIHGVVAEFTPPGGTQPVSVQTRVDFWKVGAERDN
jgi:hypothetical protein